MGFITIPMHIVVLFHNIGGYHAARLRAAQATCAHRGWTLTAIQETDNAHEHPWGDLAKEITFPLRTLLPASDAPDSRDRHPQSPLAAQQLPDCLDQLQPDVLVIPGWGYPMARTALKWASQNNRCPILMSESKWNDAPRSCWKEAIKSWMYTRKFKAALVGGQLHREYLIRLGLPDRAIFQGYDIVDNDYFTEKASYARQHSTEIRQQHSQIPDRPYFITVTRFIPRKNILRLIDAFAQYRRSVGDQQVWDLVICGSGNEEANIRSRIQFHQLEHRIHLPGFQPYQVIPYWFGLANGFIHPALSEQWGLVVNEALAAGLPSLVSDRCGCYPELIVEGVNGFGFDPENVGQLAKLMQSLAQDTQVTEQMGTAAIAHIQTFSPQIFGKGLEAAIDYALKYKPKN